MPRDTRQAAVETACHTCRDRPIGDQSDEEADQTSAENPQRRSPVCVQRTVRPVKLLHWILFHTFLPPLSYGRTRISIPITSSHCITSDSHYEDTVTTIGRNLRN